jgi:hypothetical protein
MDNMSANSLHIATPHTHLADNAFSIPLAESDQNKLGWSSGGPPFS